MAEAFFVSCSFFHFFSSCSSVVMAAEVGCCLVVLTLGADNDVGPGLLLACCGPREGLLLPLHRLIIRLLGVQSSVVDPNTLNLDPGFWPDLDTVMLSYLEKCFKKATQEKKKNPLKRK